MLYTVFMVSPHPGQDAEGVPRRAPDQQYGTSVGLITLAVRASIKSCNMAVDRVLHAPTSFLDRTPVSCNLSCHHWSSANT